MFQSHLMQIIAFVIMEPPLNADAEQIRDEKLKALKSLRLMNDPEVLYNNTIRAQYVSSIVDGKKVKGYRDEEDVDSNSKTETYAALKFFVDNWRWADVPFLRAHRQAYAHQGYRSGHSF